MLQFVLFFLSIVLILVLGAKTKINIGLWGMLAAFIFGIVFLKENAATVFKNYFPVSLFSTLFAGTAFFGAVAQTGTMDLITKKFLRLIRGKGWMAPILLYVLMMVLGFVGAGDGSALPLATFGAIIMSQLGVNPFLGVFPIWCAFASTMLLPWNPAGAINLGVLSGFFDEATAYSSLLYSVLMGFIFLTIMLAIAYVAYRAYKPKGQISHDIMEMDHIECTPAQKKTLIVMAVTLLCIIIPSVTQLIAPNPVTAVLSQYFSVVFCFITAVIVMCLMGLVESRDILTHKVAWDLAILIIGVSMLFGEAQKMGVIDILNNVIMRMPEILILPMLGFIGAILSMFVSGLVLLPLFGPVLGSMAAAANCSIQFVIFVLLIGMAVSCGSPASGAGATQLSGLTTDELRIPATKGMTMFAVINSFAFAVFVFIVQFIV